MIETLSRRKLLGGLGLLIAAPAIVKVASIMPVKAYNPGTILIDDPVYITAAEINALQEQCAERLAAYLKQRMLIEEGVRRWWKEQFEDLQNPANRLIGLVVG